MLLWAENICVSYWFCTTVHCGCGTTIL